MLMLVKTNGFTYAGEINLTGIMEWVATEKGLTALRRLCACASVVVCCVHVE